MKSSRFHSVGVAIRFKSIDRLRISAQFDSRCQNPTEAAIIQPNTEIKKFYHTSD